MTQRWRAGVLQALLGIDRNKAASPLEGASLRDRFDQPIARRGALSLAKQLFGGLLCLQEAGVRGIEITPAAVLVRRSGDAHERPAHVLDNIADGDVAIARAPPSPDPRWLVAAAVCCACLETLRH